MSAYLVLARKYRPHHFRDVVGQEVVTRVLSGALDEGRTGHAYLFSGPRGTGKTTLARILAKCLNCESGPTSDPCGTCERCVGADEGSEVDIIELDAASNTGVDTIRELRDEVAYAPMRARHKVYIVDEVHMLSKGAFNALLKTLEEPPPHVVFLFATTEQHKVLDTIQSRCQVLRLNSLTEEQIVGRLQQVFEAEGIHPGPGVVEEIARAARGGMRDALSLSDELLALGGDTPTLEDMRRLGGDGGIGRVKELLDALLAGDRRGVLELVAEATGTESELVAGLLGELRKSIVAVHCGAESPLLGGTEADRATALERGQRLGPERVEAFLQELLRARERMRLLPGSERVVLEVTLLDLARWDEEVDLADLVTRLERLEAGEPPPGRAGPAPAGGEASHAPARPSAPGRPGAPPASRAPSARPASPSPPTPAAASAAPTGSGADARTVWKAALESLSATHATLVAELGRSASLVTLEPGRAVLRLDPALDDARRRLLTDRRNQAAVKKALSKTTGRTLELELEEGASAAAPEAPSGSAPEEANEPERPRRPDPFTREVADLFGGVIEDLP